MDNESETNILHEDNDTIEEKRRKNVVENQKFLESLKLVNVRDDIKSTVNSITTKNKPLRKKLNQKKNIDPSDIRRSSRIQSMSQINYNDQFTLDDKDIVLSTDETSSDEDDDLSSAFTAKIDKDWEPLHSQKLPTIKTTRPIRKAAKKVSGGVKIFMPNTGLEASKLSNKDTSHKSYVSKKMNVAISSSSEEED